MYLTLRNRPSGSSTTGARQVRRKIPRTVVLLGIVSMVTDISSESVNAVLPAYLVLVVGLSPQGFGVVNGLYNGVSALVRLAGGWTSDRLDRPKWVAFAGYGISALSKVALLFAHSLAAFSAIASCDQVGKGIRTAPRDGIISAAAPPEQLSRAFGVHRALDTLGAFIGPLMAFWLLTLVPNDYHSVFVFALAFSAIGLAALFLVVPDIRRGPATAPVREIEIPAEDRRLQLLRNPALTRLVGAAALLGLMTVGEAFLFLELQYRDGLAIKYYPLLIVGMNLAYLCLAVPVGRLADRVGRWKVLLGGYVALLLAYLAAGGPFSGGYITIGCLCLLGAYYAATDGVLAAMASRTVPAANRTTGIAVAQTVMAAASFASSIGFAQLWTIMGRADALQLMAGLLLVCLPVAFVLLRGVETGRFLGSVTAA